MAERLYSIGEPAANAFLLRSGEVQYWVTDNDCVTLSGNNIIIGASELMIAMNRREAVRRHATLVPLPGAICSPIPAEKLVSFLSNYTVGFSVAHHIAETITKLHAILADKMNRLHETERMLRDISKTYVEIIGLLDNESQNRHFPWLFSIVEKAKATGSYNFGLAFINKNEEKPIDVSGENMAQYKHVYPMGSIITKEGDKGTDMFILMEGKIEVRIKNNPIDIIVKKGTVIGEMGLILGTPRTATLRALENVHVVKIGSRDMQSIFKNDPDTFFNMISSLAFRENDNCEMIREYTDMVKEVASGRGERSVSQVHEYSRELSTLVQELEEQSRTQSGEEWLEQIRDHSRRKATALLADAGVMTGNTYVAETDEQPPAASAPQPVERPVRDTTVPKIDWF